MLKNKKLEIPNEMGVGTMAWGDEKAGFVSDPKHRPKRGEYNPADLQVKNVNMAWWRRFGAAGAASAVERLRNVHLSII